MTGNPDTTSATSPRGKEAADDDAWIGERAQETSSVSSGLRSSEISRSKHLEFGRRAAWISARDRRIHRVVLFRAEAVVQSCGRRAVSDVFGRTQGRARHYQSLPWRLPRSRTFRVHYFRGFDSLREKANPPIDLPPPLAVLIVGVFTAIAVEVGLLPD